MDNLFNSQKDRSRSFLHVEAASSSVDNAGMAYQSPSLIAAGGAEREVSILSAATSLLFALILVKIPAFVNGSNLKKVVVILAAISAGGWLPLVLLPLFIPAIPVGVLVALWLMNAVPGLIILPLRDKWLSDIVPSGKIGRYLGLRQIISASMFISTFLMMGYLLDGAHRVLLPGFSFVFLIGFLGCALSVAMYLVLRFSPKLGQYEESKFGLLDFLWEAKQNKMLLFMIYVTMVTFAASISSAFFSVYMLRDLQFSYLTYTLLISTEFLSRVVGLSFWGKLVDNAGAVKVLRIASFFIPIVPALWLFSSNPVYLAAVQIFSGLSWSAFDLSTQTSICSASPPAKRLLYIVYQRCIIMFASAAGPLLGLYLVDVVFPVFGNPVLTIFLISAVCRFLVVITLSHRLRSSDYSVVNEETSDYDPFFVPGQYVYPGASYPKYQTERRITANPVPVIKNKPLPEKEESVHWTYEPGCSGISRVVHKYPTLSELRNGTKQRSLAGITPDLKHQPWLNKTAFKNTNKPAVVTLAALRNSRSHVLGGSH